MSTRRFALTTGKVKHLTISNVDSYIDVYGPRLRAALVGRFGPVVGDDAYADVLGYAWRNWARLAPMQNATGYLYKVGVGRGRRHRVTRAIPIPMASSGVPEVTDDLPDLDLQEALKSLSRRQREVAVLVYAYGHSHAEAAEVLGISKSTVQNHAERALKALEAKLSTEREADV